MKQIENLYILYKEDVYKYLISLTHNSTLSEDLLSETFINAIKSIHNFKGNSSVKTWLFSIARHVWLQNLRRDRPTVEYNDLLELYVRDSIEEKIITTQAIDRILKLLSEKEERVQKVVNMRIEGFSYLEISKEVGISESSARVIDFRTKKWIKSILEKEGLI